MKSRPLLKSLVAALVAVTSALVAAPSGAAPSTPLSRIIPNQYIVVLKPSALPSGQLAQGIRTIAQTALTSVGGGVVLNHYDSALLGFSARITPIQAAALAALPFVASVEADQIMNASATQTAATWGLDRVDQRAMPLNGTYIYRDQAGAGVHVYVIDTGLNPNHNEFTGRVGAGRNFASNSTGFFCVNLGINCAAPVATNTTDCNGHGTHVSGTAVGTLYGVAKKATVHPVRVLGCGGSGSNEGVIAGVDWVKANSVKPAVANMSLGGGDSPALDTAVQNLIASGVAIAVAAGNDSANACTGSPNKVPAAITVGSTTNTDAMSSFSNFGPCVDVFGPGSNITSANYANNTGSSVLSGTSMASPHVAGALALLLGQTPNATPADLAITLLGDATPGVLTGLGAGSPNALLYTAH